MTHLWWYVARSSGIVTWVLVTASVLWGLLLSTKLLGRLVRPNWLLDLHRFLGAAGVVFLAIHLSALVADSWTHFGLTALLVPFASEWHPVPVAWGVVAAYLLVAVEVTSLLRRRLPPRVWRATHTASFPLYALSTLHGLTAGSDSGNRYLQVAMAASVGAVVVLALSRLPRPAPRTTPA